MFDRKPPIYAPPPRGEFFTARASAPVSTGCLLQHSDTIRTWCTSLHSGHERRHPLMIYVRHHWLDVCTDRHMMVWEELLQCNEDLYHLHVIYAPQNMMTSPQTLSWAAFLYSLASFTRLSLQLWLHSLPPGLLLWDDQCVVSSSVLEPQPHFSHPSGASKCKNPEKGNNSAQVSNDSIFNNHMQCQHSLHI